jgi:glycerol-1-phosphate dehydrogenase [NAD(P)+]
MVADLDVLSAAPGVMSGSGYGDLIGKVVAGADWIIADALGIEPIEASVWNLVQGPLRTAIGNPQGVAAGDQGAIEGLSEGLVMSGLAMQAYHGSRPASGSEHHFSHLWEMEGLGMNIAPRRLSHGFKVGLGTISMAAFYQRVFRMEATDFDIEAALRAWQPWEKCRADVAASFANPSVQAAAIKQSQGKYADRDALEARLNRFVQVWPVLKPKLEAQLMTPEQLRTMIGTVGAPVRPAQINLTWDRFRDSYRRSQMIRTRYTLPDLAYDFGILQDITADLFAPDGFWGQQLGD